MFPTSGSEVGFLRDVPCMRHLKPFSFRVLAIDKVVCLGHMPNYQGWKIWSAPLANNPKDVAWMAAWNLSLHDIVMSVCCLHGECISASFCMQIVFMEIDYLECFEVVVLVFSFASRSIRKDMIWDISFWIFLERRSNFFGSIHEKMNDISNKERKHFFRKKMFSWTATGQVLDCFW